MCILCCYRLLSVPQLPDGSFEKCRVYEANWTDVLAKGLTQPDPEWPIKPCDKGWEYDFTEIPYKTIATEVSRAFQKLKLILTSSILSVVTSLFG